MRRMQSIFRRSSHDMPGLNLASMPDLIFTVLFFFMIVTHMRSDEVKVRLEVPAGHEVKKLAGHPAVVNIYIGRGEKSEVRGERLEVRGERIPKEQEWQVQLNGNLVTPAEIPARIGDIRSKLSAENAERLTVSLRADKQAPMGLVSDVKQALQQSYALKINYNATELK